MLYYLRGRCTLRRVGYHFTFLFSSFVVLGQSAFSNETAPFDHGYDHESTSAFTPIPMHMNALPIHDGLASIFGKSSDMVFKTCTMVASRQSNLERRSPPHRYYTRHMSLLDALNVHAGGAGSLLWRWTYRIADGPIDKPSTGVSRGSFACFYVLRSCLFW